MYTSTYFGDWEAYLAEVVLIAEATDETGAWGEDWFLEFFVADNTVARASVYAEGCHETLAKLGDRLDGLGELGLGGSATFASRGLWPAEVYGEDLYNRKPISWFKIREDVKPEYLDLIRRRSAERSRS